MILDQDIIHKHKNLDFCVLYQKTSSAPTGDYGVASAPACRTEYEQECTTVNEEQCETVQDQVER